MATPAQKVRLGVFMVLALVILIGTVGTLAGLKLWNPRDEYFIRYKESISGLDVGSAVKMKGVQVGQVDRISMDDVETVRVSLTLDPGTPIKTDTRAVISTLGITGMGFVELTGGSKRATALQPNGAESEIKPGASVTQTLTGKALDISTKMELVINNLLALTNEPNRVRIRNVLDSADKALASLATTLEEKRTERILNNLERTSTSVAHSAATINKLIQDTAPSVRTTLVATSSAANAISTMAQRVRPQRAIAEFTRAATSLRERLEDPAITNALAALETAATTVRKISRELISVVKRNDRQLSQMWTLLTDASRYLKGFSRSIKERPSLLLRGETVKERDF